MPRIKSLLNGEVSNVRGDIAREMIKLGVAEEIDPIEEVTRKGRIAVSTDGTVIPDGEPAYRLPKPGDAQRQSAAASRFYVDDFVNTAGDRLVSIFLEIGNVTRRFAGDPSRIHDRRDHSGREFCSLLGFPVPVDIQKEYVRRWKQNPGKREYVPGIARANELSKQDGLTWQADTLNSNDAMEAERKARHSHLIAVEQELSGNAQDLRGDAAVIAEAKRKINACEKLAGVELTTDWKKEGF
jgi:hypothetical protein